MLDPNLTTKTSKGSLICFNTALSIASLIHFILFPKAPLPSYVNKTLTLLPRFIAIIAAADNVASYAPSNIAQAKGSQSFLLVKWQYVTGTAEQNT